MNDTPQNQPVSSRSDANDAVVQAGVEIPTADVRTGPNSASGQFTRILRGYGWLIAAAILIAIVLTASAWWTRGPAVRVHFNEGHGIKPGDAVKYRGIEVGKVRTVRLKEDGTGIYLELQLAHEARHLAREGTQFWIERPQVSLGRVRGLETVVGAKFVELLPGPESGEPKFDFAGSDTPIWLDNPGETEVIIDFREGWGLRVGAPLRYRSVEIGEVMGVALGHDLQTVQVRVRLTQSGSDVARVGSQFWIERADISAAGIRGLDTVIGGSYLAVIPGPATADTQRHFVGLDEPPAALERSPAGLEIILTSSHRRGLSHGALVTYRGLAVGSVISVGLAADSVTVEARVYIQPQYKHLVRPETKFWYLSGFQLDAGVSGMELELESIETLFRGGVAMATPEGPGPPVSTGRRFALNDEPDNDWLEWNPQIAVGLLPSAHRLPSPARARLQWQGRRLGFRRTDQMFGWLLPLDSKRWMGLADFLDPSDGNREETELEIEGRVYRLDQTRLTTRQQVSLVQLDQWETDQALWPASHIRIPSEPEDCLIVTGDRSVQLPLAAGRLHPADGGWTVDTSLSFDETDWHGACVVATADAVLVGILSVEERVGRVVFIPKEFTRQ